MNRPGPCDCIKAGTCCVHLHLTTLTSTGWLNPHPTCSFLAMIPTAGILMDRGTSASLRSWHLLFHEVRITAGRLWPMFAKTWFFHLKLTHTNQISGKTRGRGTWRIFFFSLFFVFSISFYFLFPPSFLWCPVREKQQLEKQFSTLFDSYFNFAELSPTPSFGHGSFTFN